MVATNSAMLPLGTIAPDFELPDPSGTAYRLDDIAAGSAALVVMFLSNHCPYVRRIGREIGLITQTMLSRDVAVVGIMSNDVDAYPADAPPLMAATARSFGWDFAYLYDESQSVARAYGATCTPDFFVFDADRSLAYRGQFDGARPSNDVAATGRDLKAAVDALRRGETPSDEQFASLGCNIKWRTD